MDHQQNPGSSSKLRIQNEATEKKVEVGEVKMKTGSTNDSSSSSSSHVQVAVEENPIQDLPAEMKMEILKHVDTPSLFSCRLVSREWNEMSSEILRSRPDTEIRFGFHDSDFENCTKRREKRNLKDFTTCFKKSKNCALSYFNFSISNYSEPLPFFDRKDWIEFLSVFKDKSFKLKIFFNFQIQEFEVFSGKLRDLLVNKVPYLEEFGLNFIRENNSSQFKLFSTAEEKDTNSSSVQLTHLKVLRVDYSSFLKYPGIFQDLIISAVNLKKIEPFFIDNDFDVNVFQFLHSLGKIHCLKTARIHVTPNLLSTLKQTTDSPLPFKLKKLRLFMGSILENPSTWTEVTSFISSILESNKTTLTSLSLTPSGFLHGLKFPTFLNLTELKLFHRLEDESRLPLQMFPNGVRSADAFPAVRFLGSIRMKDWSGAFPQEDSIPRLPSVKSLTAIDCGMTGNCISKLALMCPNLKEWKAISNFAPPKLNFLQVGRAIWTHMKQLETLAIDICVDVNSPENTRFALDSCVTGISTENCQRLYEVTEAADTLKKWGCQFQIPQSFFTPVREYPSILEMKDLKQLTLNPNAGRGLPERSQFFTNCLTWISQEYAFKLMPQLQITGFSTKTE